MMIILIINNNETEKNLSSPELADVNNDFRHKIICKQLDVHNLNLLKLSLCSSYFIIGHDR